MYGCFNFCIRCPLTVSLCTGIETDAVGSGGATPTVGQGGRQSCGPKSGVGKKKSGRSRGAQQGSTAVEENDPDGSFRVPGYRGVWINTAGKHFVKINGERYKEAEDEDVLFFDLVDDAARKYDELAKKNKKKNQKLELNFKADGNRIVYEDIIPASTSGLGGSASNVVPALSVINIKVCLQDFLQLVVSVPKSHLGPFPTGSSSRCQAIASRSPTDISNWGQLQASCLCLPRRMPASTQRP